ncbi:MAG: calcium-binding protein [Gemmobacter sp.]|nr:calcium-binding protein [Gemmobacter sp.]
MPIAQDLAPAPNSTLPVNQPALPTNQITQAVIWGTAGSDDLRGTDGDDILRGFDGNDRLAGYAGDDILDGGAGEDTLYGAGGGNNEFYGGPDWDTLSYAGSTTPVFVDLAAQRVQRPGEADHYFSIQTLILSEGNDVVLANRPYTRVYLGGGDDTVRFEDFPGRVFLYGGGGTDTLDFRAYEGDVNLYGGRRLFLGKISGFEVVLGSETHANFIADPNRTGPSLLVGGSQADTLLAMGGNDTLIGGGGNDSLNGNNGDDLLLGGDGDDVLNGGRDQDRLSGDAGHDSLRGNDGDDFLSGGVGLDLLYGGEGDDQILGGDDDDHLGGGGGNDTLHGGTGNDLVVGGAGRDSLAGQDGDDTLLGSDGADSLYGGSGDDVLIDQGTGTQATVAYGGAGNDIIRLGAGTAMGGAGDDIIMFWAATPIYGDISVQVDGGAGNDRISLDISLGGSVTGGAGDDILTLRNAATGMLVEPYAQLNGGVGRDTLVMTGGINLHLEAPDYVPFPGASVVQGFERVILTSDNRLTVHADNTSVLAQSGAQTLSVYAENVAATLSDGADLLFIGSRGGRIDAGAGDDEIYNESTLDGNVILAGAGNDRVTMEGGGAVLMGDGDDFAFLRGWYNDTSGAVLNMGAGNDLVWVQSAFTRIALGDGDDVIEVSVGTPVDGVVAGGAGADRFIFGEGIGRVVVQDFEIGTDRMQFAPFNPLSLAALADIRQVGTNTELLYLSDPSSPEFATLIVLQGIVANDLTDAILF